MGQDAANGKVTYVTLLGVEEAEKLAAEYTQNALDALDAFDDVEYLREATKYLLNREN